MIAFTSCLRSVLFPLCVAAATATAAEVRTIPGWGTWTKRPDPVFVGQYGIAGDPSVVRVGSVLRMAFGGFDPMKVPQGPATCGAESPDGIAWTELDTGDDVVRGRLIRPGTGPWEDTHETPCWFRRADGTWMMWFIGYIDVGGWVASAPAGIGFAVSDDGLDFTAPDSTPVIVGTSDLDDFTITAPSVAWDGSAYRMVYAGWGFPSGGAFRGQLRSAISTDGRLWTIDPDPVFAHTVLPAYIDEHLAEPDLVQALDGTWVLLFTATHGSGGHDIGLATAPDPAGPWTICPEPIIRPTPGTFDAAQAVAPCALIEDGRIRVWYAGFNEAETQIAIGYAEAAWPLGGEGEGVGSGSGGSTKGASSGSGCGKGSGIAGGVLGLGLLLSQIWLGRNRSFHRIEP